MKLKKEYYDQFDGDLDEKAYDSGLYIQRYWQREKMRTVSKEINTGLVLDMGCGSGMLSKELVRVNDVVALDISKKCVANARKFSPRIYPVVGDAELLPFKKESFNAIACVEVIEHIDNYSSCLNEIHMLLKNNGKLYLTTPNYRSFWPIAELIWDTIGKGRDYRKQHVSKFNAMQLKGALRFSQFRIEELRSLFLFTPFIALFSSLLTQTFVEDEQKFLSKHHWGMLLFAVAAKKDTTK